MVSGQEALAMELQCPNAGQCLAEPSEPPFPYNGDYGDQVFKAPGPGRPYEK